jgi:DNA polymerase, archaea type
VFTKKPAHVPIIRDEIKNHQDIENCYEYDIQFVNRYILDKDITPLMSTPVTGSLTNEPARVPVFEAKEMGKSTDESVENLNILSLDIETYNPEGESIQPEKNPILMVALYGIQDNKPFEKVITWKRFKTTNKAIEFVDGEFDLITRFKDIINQHEPDVITGYYSDGFDLPYIVDRARKYKIKLDIGLDNSEIIIDKRNSTAQITGIVHLDAYRFVRRVLAQSLKTDSYKLDAVAHELLGDNKIPIDISALAYVWDNHPEKLEEYAEYNLHDARITYNLLVKILPNIEELTKIIGFPPFAVNRMSFSRLVESYIMTQARQFNEVALNKPDYNEMRERRSQTYEGAFVFEPTPGLYENVVVFDFRSLYPTLITSHNISQASLNCNCCKDTEEKQWFCKKKKGFLPSVLENIITRRMRIKEIIRAEPEKNTLLNARSDSLKLLANSFYGYLGFAPARWYSIESARTITALGRQHIHNVIDKAKEKGFGVLYSDTDSVFLELKENSKDDAHKFVDTINADLPGLMELEYEGFYPSALFVSAKAGDKGAKKKYALLAENGMLQIKGFETVRRNWSVVAKEVQEKVLNIILKEKDPKKAAAYVKDVLNQIKEHTLPIEKTVIKMQLQKPIDSYDSIGPHVAVARRMHERGIPVDPGTLISFVVTEGKGIIRDRARMPSEVHDNEYDAEYYTNNQVLPSVERIFAIFDIDAETLAEEHSQSRLGDF